MQNKRIPVAVLTLGMLLSFAPSILRADATADAKTAIQSAYAKQTAAINKKDVQGVVAVYSPDYLAIGTNGRKNRTLAETKQQLAMLFTKGQNIKATQTIQKITVKGNQATVLVKEHAEFSLPDLQQKLHRLISNSNAEDIWVKSGKSNWLKKQSKTLSNKGTVDGIPRKN